MTTHVDYDRAGRPERAYTSKETSEADEEGNITTTTTESTLSTTKYNQIGWTLESGDADGVVKNSVYDVLGNSISEEVWAPDTQTPKSTTAYTYDSKKRVKTQTVMEAGKANVITFGYDAFGRVLSEVHTKDGVTSRDVDTAFDEFGRATKVTDNKTGVVSAFDYAGGSKKSSSTNMTFGSVSSTATVDGLGRETTQTATLDVPGKTFTVDRTVAWDTTKNLPDSATVKVGGVGSAMSATFDDTDRLTDVTGGLWGSGGLHMDYDRADNGGKGTGAKTLDRAKIPWGGSLVTTERTFAFTDSGRLTQVKVNGTRTIDYSWDSAGTGNLLSVADSAGTTTTFESANGHVTKATTGANETTYVYGDTGRRESETIGATTTTYGWVGDDTLASWQRSGTSPASASYTYDGDGQRMGAVVTATSAWSPATPVETTYAFGWDGLALRYLRANSSAASATIDYLTFGEDRPFAGAYTVTRGAETTSAVFQLMANDHGDVVALADEAGEVFARYAYGPYGEAEGIETRATDTLTAALASEIAVANPLRYAGYCYDTWSGHYYLQARYYDPATKQFISKDPAEADGEESAYQYCAGDPIHQVDPTGLWGWGGLSKAFSKVKRRVSSAVRRAATVVRSVARKVTRRAVTAYKHAKTRIVAKARAAGRAIAAASRRVKSRVAAFRAAAQRRMAAVKRAVKRKAKAAIRKGKALARKAGKAAAAANPFRVESAYAAETGGASAGSGGGGGGGAGAGAQVVNHYLGEAAIGAGELAAGTLLTTIWSRETLKSGAAFAIEGSPVAGGIFIVVGGSQALFGKAMVTDGQQRLQRAGSNLTPWSCYAPMGLGYQGGPTNFDRLAEPGNTNADVTRAFVPVVGGLIADWMEQ